MTKNFAAILLCFLTLLISTGCAQKYQRLDVSIWSLSDTTGHEEKVELNTIPTSARFDCDSQEPVSVRMNVPPTYVPVSFLVNMKYTYTGITYTETPTDVHYKIKVSGLSDYSSRDGSINFVDEYASFAKERGLKKRAVLFSNCNKLWIPDYGNKSRAPR